jgi:periplasmic protein TonB
MPIILGAVVVLILLGGFLFIRSFLSGGTVHQPKVVQEVHLIRPPPPPPPEEKPPPPPPPEEKVVTPEPEQHPDPTPTNEPPPSEHLGLDAEGGAGGDAFGLVGNRGGRDLVDGAGGSAIAWYNNILRDAVREQLSAAKELRVGSYKLSIRFWLRADGSVDHVVILQGTGDQERDRMIESRLSRITLPNAPPPGFPTAATLTVVSHG